MMTKIEKQEKAAFENYFREDEEDSDEQPDDIIDLCYSRKNDMYKSTITQAMYNAWCEGRNLQREDRDQLSAERKSFENHVLVECGTISAWNEEKQQYTFYETQYRWLGWQAGRKALRDMLLGTD